MALRIGIDELRDVTSIPVDGISEHDRDEMAIPSYLHPNPLIRWLMWRRYDCIEQLAEIGPGDRVLEFGCGTGVFLPTLASSAGSVVAIDLFPQYARELARRRNLDITFAGGPDELADSSIDVIVAADVLEHVDDLPGVASLFARKLRRGGRLVVSGPTENFVYKIGRFVAGFSGKGDYHHRNIADIIGTLESSGFSVCRRWHLPFAIPPHLFTVASFRIR